jgi:hypothetical protein
MRRLLKVCTTVAGLGQRSGGSLRAMIENGATHVFGVFASMAVATPAGYPVRL